MKQWYEFGSYDELYLSRKWFLKHRNMFCDNDDCCLFLGGDLSDLDVKKIKYDAAYIANIGTIIVTEKAKNVFEECCKDDCELHHINDSELYWLEVKTVAVVRDEYVDYSGSYKNKGPCPVCGRYCSVSIGRAINFEENTYCYLDIEKNDTANLCRSPIKLGDSWYAGYAIFASELVIKALKKAKCKGFNEAKCV